MKNSAIIVNTGGGYNNVTLGHREAVAPVSYTHLDVYKRQDWV